MNSINSFCLIPEVSCSRNCAYCYEKKKNYLGPVSFPSFISFAMEIRKGLDHLEELLIDYNGVEDKENIAKLLDVFRDLPATITTTPEGMLKVANLKAKFNISIHNDDDIDSLLKIREVYPDKISCVSLMLDDVKGFASIIPETIPVYILYDKFSELWRHQHPARTMVQTRLFFKTDHLLNMDIDHCLMTRINSQPCPAHSQINIYRDGSIRRCPYDPGNPSMMDSSKFKEGCALIKENK